MPGSKRGKKQQLRFARVPSGHETCSYCLMLASRGFVYYSNETAAHGSHEGCNCLMVPGSNNTKIEGYNPGELYIQYRNSMKQKESKLLKERAFSQSLRKPATNILDEKQIEQIVQEALSIGIDPKMLSFNTGSRTSFSDLTLKVNIRGDIFPDETSSNNRDRMTSRAVLAHEVYGHMAHSINTKYRVGDWRDEFRASYRAAVDTPGLTNEERASLMIDAYERSKEAGIQLKYTKAYERIVYGYE